jgi:hypothetical protein
VDEFLEDPVEAIAQAIRDYLRRFPNARDTSRGVQEWWLPPSLRDRPFAELESALRRLVANGDVAASVLSNGTTLFSAGPSVAQHR